MGVFATYIGTASVLLEIDGLQLLTDPVFDPPGKRYSLGFGTSSVKLIGPALPAEALPPIDAILLSHDEHADNLDSAGRALLPKVGKVLTTQGGGRRLGGNAVGLAAWETSEIARGETRLRVTATPARHGWKWSLPIVGEVIGFSLEGASLRGPLYIAGDTVRFTGTSEVAKRLKPRLAFLHMGKVGFGITGPLRYTMSAQSAAAFAGELGAEIIVPIHFEGWTHFREGRAEAEAAFNAAGLGPRVRWLTPGVRTAL